MANETVTLAHGAGGTQTAQLIDGCLRHILRTPASPQTMRRF